MCDGLSKEGLFSDTNNKVKQLEDKMAHIRELDKQISAKVEKLKKMDKENTTLKRQLQKAEEEIAKLKRYGSLMIENGIVQT